MFCCQTGSYGLTFWVPTIVKGLSGYTRVRGGHCSRPSRTSRRRWAWCWSAGSSDRTGERFLHVAMPSLIGAAGFPRGGTTSFTRARDAGACPSPPSATTARADRSGRCRANSWPAAPPRVPSRSSIPWARSAAPSARARSAGSRIATGGFLAPMLMLSGVLFVGAILTLSCAARPHAPRLTTRRMGTSLFSGK